MINSQLGIQRKLLSEGELTYDSALKLALTVEALERDCKTLVSGEDSKTLVSGEDSKKDMNYTSITSGTISCYHGGGAHLAPQCKHHGDICHYCKKKKGYFSSVCRTKACHPLTPPPCLTHIITRSRNLSNYVEVSSSSETEYDMHILNNKCSEPYMMDVVLNTVPIKVELDTGAAVSIINESTYNDI